MFSDQYLDKEENSKVQDVLFRLLTTEEIGLNPIDADDPEVSGNNNFQLIESSLFGSIPVLYSESSSLQDKL